MMFFDIGKSGLPSEVIRLPAVTSFKRRIFGPNRRRSGAVNRSLTFSTIKLTVIADPSGPSAGAGVKLTRAEPAGGAVAGGAVAGGAVAGGAIVGGATGSTSGAAAAGPAAVATRLGA